ncbi:hypothetical protein Pmani_021517 [Petrolisthes manimaculis]|uniref:Uncharacterized protein n=1 Tax=Petrolisthes manimaculis TaxID=1843537 RepID=A0AAE1PEM7_9EUCA|nr:hypothetical protein Pmani_021517 [Petrolisthes manimaculis]
MRVGGLGKDGDTCEGLGVKGAELAVKSLQMKSLLPASHVVVLALSDVPSQPRPEPRALMPGHQLISGSDVHSASLARRSLFSHSASRHQIVLSSLGRWQATYFRSL